MKNRHFLVVCIMVMLPLATPAQENIKRAFDALINDSQATVSATHKMNKDPESGVKEGQLDVYEFTLPISSLSLVKNIERAFDKDKDKAYSLNTAGTKGKKKYDYESLAVGGGNAYQLGDIRGSRYIYALFLDPDDESKAHRYAYVLEWLEGSKEIEGKLAITYATTLKYRQHKGLRTVITDGDTSLSFSLGDLENGDLEKLGELTHFGMSEVNVSSSESWLMNFNNYKNFFLKKTEGAAANVYATQIYKLCKKAECLEEAEKELVVSEIQKLKAKTTDEFIQQLFDMSINRLKK
jgi:hypothetical protein